jgi:hypothetical protein
MPSLGMPDNVSWQACYLSDIPERRPSFVFCAIMHFAIRTLLLRAGVLCTCFTSGSPGTFEPINRRLSACLKHYCLQFFVTGTMNLCLDLLPLLTLFLCLDRETEWRFPFPGMVTRGDFVSTLPSYPRLLSCMYTYQGIECASFYMTEETRALGFLSSGKSCSKARRSFYSETRHFIVAGSKSYL